MDQSTFARDYSVDTSVLAIKLREFGIDDNRLIKALGSIRGFKGIYHDRLSLISDSRISLKFLSIQFEFNSKKVLILVSDGKDCVLHAHVIVLIFAEEKMRNLNELIRDIIRELDGYLMVERERQFEKEPVLEVSHSLYCRE